MSLSASEKETIWSYDEASATANIYTHSKTLRKQLHSLAKDHPDECKLRRDYGDGSEEYDLPKAWLKIRPPRRLSPAQLEAARNALAKTRNKTPEPGQN